MEDVYRQCASVVVLRPASVCAPGEECTTLFEVLLVHKPRKNDAWQLPQGGVEPGESLEDAALRELKEEAGVDARAIAKSAKTYQYDFPASFRKHRPDNVCGQHISYVFAEIHSDATVSVDEQEIDSYAWVLPEQLPKYIKRKQYRELVEELVEEGAGKLRIEN